jgi:hypothetical protein
MDAPAPDDPAVAPTPEKVKKANLSSQQRKDIVSTLPLAVEPGDLDMKLSRGAIKLCTDTYRVGRWKPSSLITGIQILVPLYPLLK